MVISYGPCQFPTLGFIVERYKLIRDFQGEKFWTLTLKCLKQGKQEEVKFEWERERLFDKLACLVLMERC